MVPLTPLASHDADASANSVKWLKKIMFHDILISGNNKCNGTIYDAISAICCQHYHLKAKK